VRWLVFTLALAVGACTGSGASETCKDVCKRDAECHDELRDQQEEDDERAVRFDRDECEATCAALERDSKGRELVAKHAKCVRAADSCTTVRACD
jgi:hypothetical protein